MVARRSRLALCSPPHVRGFERLTLHQGFLIVVDPSTGRRDPRVDLAADWRPAGSVACVVSRWKQIVVIRADCGAVVAAEVVRWLSIFRPEQQRGSCRHPVSPSGLPTVGGSISNSSVNRCCWFRQTWSARGPARCRRPGWRSGCCQLRRGLTAMCRGDARWFSLFVETGVIGPDGGWKPGRGNVWIDHVGRRRSAPHGDRGRSDADVSPDGTQIAHARLGAAGDVEPGDLREIWSLALMAATNGATISSTPPTWSPDGRLLLRDDDEGWFTVLPDGTGRSEITSVMPANRDFICCPYNQPSWQPLRPGSRRPTESPVTVKSPASDVTGWLGERSDELAFVVSSPTASYWRLAALADFDGTTWGLTTSRSARPAGLTSGVELAVHGDTVTQTFEITGLDGQLLAASRWCGWTEPTASPSILKGPLVTMSETADGLEYTVESVLPVMTSPTSRPPTRHPRRRRTPSRAPGRLPDRVGGPGPPDHRRGVDPVRAGHRLAELVPGFVYDLSFPAGHSQSAMLEFVAQRRGYSRAVRRHLRRPRPRSGCRHGSRRFHRGRAGRRRPLLRAGQARPRGPEVYFEGVGWVPFEPTPGGSPANVEYTGVLAAQADNGGD